ncbi:unnamed protein product [Symbiodinium necroappetens]|uniref:Uncharacterized protein n=1 Tax=Symbiodinium necroappetens TaxID=1628268 RepID=A0A812WTB3_9DINO|nr:unnamed protein product [Symbiodinium necroappetens]
MHARPSPQGWSQWPVTVSAQAAAPSPQVQAVQGSRSQGAAPPFPCLPTSLSRQHLPDREPGSFTPPAGVAGFGPPASRVPSRQGTPPSTARATSPENPTAVIVASNQGASFPRSPGKTRTGQSGPGLPSGSTKTTPKPANRQVLSFVPGQRPGPNTAGGAPQRQAQHGAPSSGGSGIYLPGDGELRAAPAQAQAQTKAQSLRGASVGRAAASATLEARASPRATNEFRYSHSLIDATGRSDEASRHSDDTIPEAAWPERRLHAAEEHPEDERARLQRELRTREARCVELQERLEGRERNVTARESDLVAREKRVADREADLAKMFDRLTEREEQQRKESQSRLAELSSKEEGLKLQLQDARNRNADLHCRQADLDQREAKLRAEEERCRDLKRGLDERDARWHEAAKDASLVLKPHLKPRMSPRGKENVELQRQLEEQRGLMHKIKRKQDSWAEGEEGGRGHRDSFGSEETVTGPGY